MSEERGEDPARIDFEEYLAQIGDAPSTTRHRAVRPRDDDAMHFIIKEYFAQISASTIDETVERFFTTDATFTLFPSGRIFEGHDGIATMFRSVFGRHPVIEREILDIVIDAQAALVSASFRATVPNSEGPPTIMHNVNFWRFEGAKFTEVKVFSSDAAL